MSYGFQDRMDTISNIIKMRDPYIMLNEKNDEPKIISK